MFKRRASWRSWLSPRRRRGRINERAAACLARCAGLAEKDKNLSSADREKLVNDYADRAVALLRQAIAHGFKDADYLRRTADFEPLRRAKTLRRWRRKWQRIENLTSPLPL